MTDTPTEVPTTAMPSDVLYGKVVGRFILAIADQSDPGREPDAVPASGTITFTPATPNRKMSQPELTTVVAQPIRCQIDPDGHLVDPEGENGVWLITGQYRVNYSIQNAVISQHLIDVQDTHTEVNPLDLTNALPPSGPSLSPTQYSALLAMIQNIQFPVKTVNGQIGDVSIIIPEDLVQSVNGKQGTVVLSADDINTYDKTYIDEQLNRHIGVVRGPWDSAFHYTDRDLVTIDGILWYCTQDNLNTRPVADVSIVPAGGDGGPGNYDMQFLAGNNKEMLHPIRLNRPAQIGSIDLLVHAGDSGLPAGKIGICAAPPVQNSSSPAIPITEMTDFLPQAGSGWKTIILKDPIPLQADTDYWIYVVSPDAIGTLSGWYDYYWTYTSPMVRPQHGIADNMITITTDGSGNPAAMLRPDDASAWTYQNPHTFVRLGERVPQVWEPVADLTNDGATINFPVKSVNGKLGDVVLSATDVGALTKATADTSYAPITTTSGLSAEEIRDLVGALLVQGTGIQIVVDDPGDKITLSSTATGGLSAEEVRDLIGATLVQGSGITIAVDDPGDTITISSTSGGSSSTPAGGRYRGGWSGLTLKSTADLSSIPAGWANPGGYIVTPVTPNTAGAPSGTNMLSSGVFNQTTKDISFVVPAGTTVVRLRARNTQGMAVGSSNSSRAAVVVNGVEKALTGPADAGAWMTLQVNVVAGDTVALRGVDVGVWNTSAYFGQIEFLDANAPYMTGDTVVYNGSLYSSTVDNNATTPGTAGASWTRIAITPTVSEISDATTTGKSFMKLAAAASDGQSVISDAATPGGLKWAVPATSALNSILMTQIGPATPGATFGTMANNRVYLKKIVVPTAGVISSIEAYVQVINGQVDSFGAILMSDNAGAPGPIIGYNAMPNSSLYLPNGGRWLSIAIGKYVAAGTYWIGVAVQGDTTIGMQIASDSPATAADAYYDASGAWFSDGYNAGSGYATQTAGAGNWSIRATQIVQGSSAVQPINPKTGAYTIALNDNGALITIDSGVDVTLSIPTDASVPFPIGSRIDVMGVNVGLVTVAAVTPGTTAVNGTPSLKTRARWSAISLIKRAADTWVVVGDLG